MPKSWFVDLARSFALAQRNHMRREEAEFLPLLGQRLGQSDWQAVRDKAPLTADPLFGEQIERRFTSLRLALASWDASDRSERSGGQPPQG